MIFTTIEKVEARAAVMVRADTGPPIEFSRDRLFLSVHESCKHLPGAVSDATALTEIIVSKLLKQQTSGLLSKADIKATAHTILKRFDATAAAVYSAYHP